MTEKTTVAVSSSLDRDYSFLLPLSCLLWRDVIGFDPIALLVGTESDWRARERNSIVLDQLRRFGFDHAFVGRLDGYPDHTMAQNCRQHVTALNIPDDRWVMPSDADLWPLKREFYQKHQGTGYKAVLYYANGDNFISKERGIQHDPRSVAERSAAGLRSQTIPTCHVTMKAREWRRIYGLEAAPAAGFGMAVGDVTQRTLDRYFSRCDKSDGMNLWMSDQQIMTEALCHQKWFPSGHLGGDHGSVLAVTRHGHPPVDRLCRSHPDDWGWDDFSKWTDAHLPKAPDQPEVWRNIFPMVARLLPERAAEIADYRDKHVRSYAP